MKKCFPSFGFKREKGTGIAFKDCNADDLKECSVKWGKDPKKKRPIQKHPPTKLCVYHPN